MRINGSAWNFFYNLFLLKSDEPSVGDSCLGDRVWGRLKQQIIQFEVRNNKCFRMATIPISRLAVLIFIAVAKFSKSP